MSLNSVSAVLEELIRRLCLGDFPCGYECRRQREDGGGGAAAEETQALLDLLRCPHSPWHQDHAWSPQAASLRELAVHAPGRLHANLVYTYFTTLRIMGKDVSVIDEGLLRFSKLEELVLSANKITEVPAEHLPGTLKVLELRSNLLGSLDGLVSRPLPHLQSLSLASNTLGSCEDTSHLTGKHWPQLVCLDLGDCEFQDQRALLDALSTLPRLRTLVLEGNPFSLASCYPGFTVDRLPKLFYLDSTWIFPQERDCFRGLAQINGFTFDWTSAIVTVGKLKGIPDPLMGTENNASSFPAAAYNYYVTYNFLTHQMPAATVARPAQTLSLHGYQMESKAAAKDNLEDVTSIHSKPEWNHQNDTSTPDRSALLAGADVGCVSTCSTSKVTWSEEMNFGDTQTHAVLDLDGLKRFCLRGLDLRIVEEKSPVKPGSIKDRSKNKKKPALQLLQDAPIRRVLGSVHVPLQSLLKRPWKVDVLCNFARLRGESEAEATPPEPVLKTQKDQDGGREKPSAPQGGKSREERRTEPSTEASASVQPEPATVEFSVELKKWRSAADAHHLSA